MTARSTIIKCATSSAADHLPSLGLVFHSSAGTASAAIKSPPRVFTRLAIMGSSFCIASSFHCGSSNGAAASLLERVRELQHGCFAERWTKDLQAYRKLSVDFSAGNGDAWHTCQGSRNRIYISKIHLKRVVCFLAEFK